MSLKLSCGLTALLTLCELTLSSMVLPRPPSSPNDLPRETIHPNHGKFHNEKAIYSFVQLNTNVEKPNTDGYRLLEIELGGTGEVDESNWQGLVRAMLSSEDRGGGQDEEEDEPRSKNSEVINRMETKPEPEVIPNSILGVREIALSGNYRINENSNEMEEKRTLLKPPGITDRDEKLYYLKNRSPKVDVEVRGNSGSYGGDKVIRKVSSQVSITPGEFGPVKPKNYFEKTKNRRPKKYYGPTSRGTLNGTKILDSSSAGRIYGTIDYEPRPDRANDESTTENMAVTSSELPKQIPTPPSRFLNRFRVTQTTTPIQKYSLRRTDILPGYTYPEA
ncbi:uncharacterized protein [Venturia canescens]|uniref:uncharacterized protein n=1 Tax=Venturia canescens TaxID=32260 RepID=UPI001C9C2438|nr:uncharacterized protein LOC122413858 [Venturia canescens]XP_043280427.1 uncharacterized protein LOC122413858 [Venturia canescens]XP_043280428.1 uncharacterized protein LOC122413858 [Venturia canescens]